MTTTATDLDSGGLPKLPEGLRWEVYTRYGYIHVRLDKQTRFLGFPIWNKVDEEAATNYYNKDITDPDEIKKLVLEVAKSMLDEYTKKQDALNAREAVANSFKEVL